MNVDNNRLVVLQMHFALTTFVTVFHRILDFKTGPDFYPRPLFYAIITTKAKFK